MLGFAEAAVENGYGGPFEVFGRCRSDRSSVMKKKKK